MFDWNPRRWLASGLRRLSVKSLEISRRLYRSPQEERVIPWFRDQGDQTWRLQYPLTADSVVVDLGGYKGQWSSDIYAMYCCQVHIFEPVAQFAAAIEQRFVGNPDIRVHRLGLADHDGVAGITVSADGSSMYKVGAELQSVSVKRATEYLRSLRLSVIDLMKINIEGAEYDLLNYLIESDAIYSIRNVQVQFHDFVPEAEARMNLIHGQLARTHELTYQYPFVWENWRIKPGQTLRSLLV